MYSHGKGIAKRSLPYRRTPPSWLEISVKDLCNQISKLAKKGMHPSQIGVLLRDQHGIPQIRGVTGCKILRILKNRGLAPEIPEDLYHLIKKAVSIRKHMEANNRDTNAKFRLVLTESKIHRVARFYRRVKALPPTWRYVSSSAKTLV